jgi:glucosamine--fructose-6-phosphate aminotransferase (isomerizing)
MSHPLRASNTNPINPLTPNLFREHVLSLPTLIEEVFPIFRAEAERVFDETLCQSLSRLYTLGCGDSHHACEATELAFEMLGGTPTEPMMSMQFSRYALSAPLSRQNGRGVGGEGVIGVSVSGGVTRTIEGVLRAAQRGMTTLAITSSGTTPIAKAVQHVLTTRVPDVPNAQGVQVPGSRSFFASLVMLYLSAIRLGEMRGHLSAAQAEDWRSELLSCANAIRQTVQMSDAAARDLAEQTVNATEFVFCGSGPNHASALFSAAKMLEASGDPALAQDVEEWAHLQYFAKATNTPTFLICAGERDASRADEVQTAMEAIGRRVFLVSPKAHGAVLRYAPCDEIFAPLVATIPTMLFASYRAELTGEPYFRNFGGGRSIEDGGGISRIRTSELVVDLEPKGLEGP